MAPPKGDPAQADGATRELEKECEAWDWARAAGVSAQDLRKAVRETLNDAKSAG